LSLEGLELVFKESKGHSRRENIGACQDLYRLDIEAKELAEVTKIGGSTLDKRIELIKSISLSVSVSTKINIVV